MIPWGGPWVPFLVGAVAFLYAMVGHGGASGQLAVLSLTSLRAGQVAASALILNLVVAGIAMVAFARAGHFDWRLTWPFLVGSVPTAAIGATIHLSQKGYFGLVGAVLLYAAIQMLVGGGKPRIPVGSARRGAPSGGWRSVFGVRRLVAALPFGRLVARPGLPFESGGTSFVEASSGSARTALGAPPGADSPPRPLVAVATGAAIGVLSGLVGVGGGIFLSPLMILLGWAAPKRTAATSAAFIVANSLAGLAGRLHTGIDIAPGLWLLVLCGAGGGILGARIGARTISPTGLRRMLGVVLLVAAGKLLMGVFH